MIRNSRVWIGLTLLLVILLNYAIIGIPLIRMSETIKTETRSILIKQAKAGQVFENSADDYLLGIFRKEKASVDRKMLILNSVSATIALLVMSWTVFGMIGPRGKGPGARK